MSILTDDHIDRIWARLTKMYGHKFTSSFGLSDDGTWIAGLRGITPKMVRSGLEQCLYREDEWPPTLPEFRKMCQGVDDDLIEYLSAQYMPSSFDSQRMSSDQLRKASKQAKEKAMAKIKNILNEDPTYFVTEDGTPAHKQLTSDNRR